MLTCNCSPHATGGTPRFYHKAASTLKRKPASTRRVH
jgi:hypothetical protein